MYFEGDHSYHAHYSEENVYKLAFTYKNGKFDYDNGSEAFVVFISNLTKHVPMWHQRIGPDDELPIMWDYHVIYVLFTDGEANVIDLDSKLGYRVPFEKYMKETFRPESPWTNKDYKP